MNSSHEANYIRERLFALHERLKLVEIRDPLKTLLRPEIEAVVNPDGSFSLRVRIYTIEARTGNPFLTSTTFNMLPHQVSWYSRSTEKLAGFVHHCLLETFRHEVDESVFLDGKHVIPPQHWGPTAEQVDAAVEEPDDEHGLADQHDEGDPTPDDPEP